MGADLSQRKIIDTEDSRLPNVFTQLPDGWWTLELFGNTYGCSCFISEDEIGVNKRYMPCEAPQLTHLFVN